MMRAGLAAVLLLLLVAAIPAWGQSPLVAELEKIATRYHEDPSRLDQLRTGLADLVKADSHPENFVALARVCFIWGDIQGTTRDQKLEAYEQGREAAKRAIELDTKNVAAHFWYGANTGRWGETTGVVRSLFLLPTVQAEIQTVLNLDPMFTAVYSLAGYVYYGVPGLLGGDLNKAEEMFRKGLELDPKFTGMRVGLAKTLIKKGRLSEARRELEVVLGESAPSNPADWTLKDSREARRLLESLEGRT